MSSVSNNNTLRNMACNILRCTTEELANPQVDLHKIQSSPINASAKAMFESVISTAELVEMANRPLEERTADPATSSQFAAVKAEFQERKKQREEVSPDQYRRANPDPLDAIPEDFVPQFGKCIGEGYNGRVYQVTNTEGIGNFILKEGRIDDEATMGQYIRDIQHNITPETQLSDVQGLELAVAGKTLKNRSFVQEMVQGETLNDYFQEKDWIDSPRKALERFCAIMSSLHAIGKASIDHGDLHENNIMMKKKRLPEEVITAKVEAQARQITGITREESDLTEEERQALNEAMVIARAKLTDEDQYERIPIIIDFGCAGKIGDECHEDPLADMKDSAKLIPALLFGKKGKEIVQIKDRETLTKKAKAELIQEKKNSGTRQDQLASEIMLLKDNLTELNEELTTLTEHLANLKKALYIFHEKIEQARSRIEFWLSETSDPMSQKHISTLKEMIRKYQSDIDKFNEELNKKQQQINNLQPQFDELQQQFTVKSQTYSQTYGEDIQGYEARFEDEVQEREDAMISQYVTEGFSEANDAMKAATSQSYPEPVLRELAQIMADCLSLNHCPTVEEAFKRLINLTFFWLDE